MAPQYYQKFRPEWLNHLQLKDWISQDETDKTKAFCKYCKCPLNGKLCDLIDHGKTNKHKVSASIRRACWKKLDFGPAVSDKPKKQEAALALFTCQHTSTNSVDHLSNLCNCFFESVNKIRLHRSKCTNIIKNVLSPHFLMELRKDISNSKFSILIDESTDVGVIKLLEVEDATAEGISKVIVQQLLDMKLDITKLIGIGTDNANVMVGNNKSVFVELKKLVPNIVLIRCVCHSVQLAVTHSWKSCMPDHLEFLVNETYNWFSRSYQRQQSYKHIYEAINNEEAPLKITNICDTRWLSIEVSITRIVDQWLELKTHFGIAKNYEKCFMASNLYHLYENGLNLLYLLFLKPILTQMQILNKSFQSQTSDPTKLLNDMELAINYLKQFVINPLFSIDILSENFEHLISYDCYLGYLFETSLNNLKENEDVDEEVETNLRHTCIRFVVHLILELKKRLPENYKVLKMINLLSVENVLKQNKDTLIPVLKAFISDPYLIDKINNQYNNICYVKWSDTSSSNLFWPEVFSLKDSAGNNPFAELATFALEMCSLPWSNADVERVFSQLNLVKTKLRNRMITSTVNAVLHVRYGLKLNGKCCYDYEVPANVLKEVGTISTYNNKPVEEWMHVFD